MIAAACLVASLVSSSFVIPRGPPPPLPKTKIPSDAFVMDAEVKHGRVALVSGAVLAALSANGFEHPTSVLASQPSSTQLVFFSGIALAEAALYLPRMEGMFSLKEGILPAKLLPASPTEASSKAELIACRVGMIAVFAYMLFDVFTTP
jgi:hypothetical protein